MEEATKKMIQGFFPTEAFCFPFVVVIFLFKLRNPLTLSLIGERELTVGGTDLPATVLSRGKGVYGNVKRLCLVEAVCERLIRSLAILNMTS